jgi:hypothetical protein
MSAGHTPGPWTHHPYDNIITGGVDDRTLLEWQARSLHVSIDERDANARLIAAAPDLLAELRKFVDGEFTYYAGKVIGIDARLTEDDVNRARAAITKATGDAS